MGANKHLLALMMEEVPSELQAFPSKKQIQQNGKEFAKKLLDDGFIDKQKALTEAIRLSELINTVLSVFKEDLTTENFTAYGIKATHKNGGEKLNYSEDEVYSEIQNQLKHRESLLKVAQKSDIDFYDENGVKVPKVGTTPIKSSFTFNY